MKIQRIIQFILSGGSSASVVFFIGHVFGGSPSIDLAGVVFMMFVSAMALSPVVLWWILASFIKSVAGRYVLSAFATVSFAYGAFIYYNGLVVHVGALNGLLLVFFPLYQDGALALLFGIIRFWERR